MVILIVLYLHDNTIHATNVASYKFNAFEMLSVNMVGLNGENEKYVKVKTCIPYTGNLT